MNLLEVKNICKTYGHGEAAVHALRDVSSLLLSVNLVREKARCSI